MTVNKVSNFCIKNITELIIQADRKDACVTA
jgi:hypothetical protein